MCTFQSVLKSLRCFALVFRPAHLLKQRYGIQLIKGFRVIQRIKRSDHTSKLQFIELIYKFSNRWEWTCAFFIFVKHYEPLPYFKNEKCQLSWTSFYY